MKKIAVFAVVGIVLSFAGIYLLFLYLTSLDSGGNVLFLILSIVLFAAGAYSFILATKPVVPKQTTTAGANPTQGKNILERNNEMLGDYKKTSDARDRLKVLEVASEGSN